MKDFVEKIFVTAPTPTPTPAADAVLDTIVEVESPTVSYICKAPPGSYDDDPVWQVARLTTSQSQTKLENAAGGAFINKKVDRAILLYGTNTTPPTPPPPDVVPPPSTAFVQSIINQMNASPAGTQLGYNRNVYAATGIGMKVTGDRTPTYWSPSNLAYKSSAYWQVVSPWWVALPLVGNTVSGLTLQIGRVITLVRAKNTQNWRQIYNALISWAGEYDNRTTTYIGPVTRTPGVAGAYNYIGMPMLAAGNDHTLHGGGGAQAIDFSTVDGLIHLVAARLQGANAATSNFALTIGVDAYPVVGYNVGANPPSWVPYIVSGQMLRLTDQWAYFAACALDSPGRGNQASSYPADTSGAFMSTATLLANPVAQPVELLP